MTFRANESIQQHVMGGLTGNHFELVNHTDDTLYILPIHSVVPNKAAIDFIMGQCFCFTALEIAPRESRRLDLTYGYKPDMDLAITSAQVGYDLRLITCDEYLTRQAEAAEVTEWTMPGAVDPSNDPALRKRNFRLGLIVGGVALAVTLIAMISFTRSGLPADAQAWHALSSAIVLTLMLLVQLHLLWRAPTMSEHAADHHDDPMSHVPPPSFWPLIAGIGLILFCVIGTVWMHSARLETLFPTWELRRGATNFGR